MTVEEIFKNIVSHVLEGIMMHEEFANYFAFLGLHEYEGKQREQYLEESKLLNSINEHYINSYCKLIPRMKLGEIPKHIPDSMFGHVTEDLEANNIRQAVKTISKAWVEWEEKTKQLFEESYVKLVDDNSAVCSASFVKGLIEDVDKELAEAREFWLSNKLSNFDITKIMEEQKWWIY